MSACSGAPIVVAMAILQLVWYLEVRDSLGRQTCALPQYWQAAASQAMALYHCDWGGHTVEEEAIGPQSSHTHQLERRVALQVLCQNVAQHESAEAGQALCDDRPLSQISAVPAAQPELSGESTGILRR